MVPLGIGTATCSIVGNALGRGYSALAHSVTMISMGVFLCCWVVMAIAMLLCMQYLVRFFTDDPKVTTPLAPPVHLTHPSFLFESAAHPCVLALMLSS
jgi:Na+-driven multidrug efflux pump